MTQSTRIFIGSDHGGFPQKNRLISVLEKEGYQVTDCGTYSSESTDYPDFALAVGHAVEEHPEAVGILLCRSGEGMEMAINKMPKLRGALVWKAEVAKETRRDNDANVLVLPSDFISEEEAEEIAHTFLITPFSGEERHIRRLVKLHAIEHTVYES